MAYIFPKISDDKEFENLVRDFFKIRTRNNNFQNYGREGQSQFGIDSFGQDFENSEFIVVQSKNYTKVKSTAALKTSIQEELEKFDTRKLKFYDEVKKYYFISSLENDTLSQDYALEVDADRKLNEKCGFQLILWQELIDELTKPQYEYTLYDYFTKALVIPKLNLPPVTKENKFTTSIKYDDLSEIHEWVNFFKEEFYIDDNVESRYDLTIGFICNEESLNSYVDIEIDFSKFYNDALNVEEKWQKSIECIKNLAIFISQNNKIFSNRILILQKKIHPNLAFLIGIGLKKRLSDKNYNIVFKDIVFSNVVGNLHYQKSGISERRIEIIGDGKMNECILVFNGVTSNQLNYEDLVDKFTNQDPAYRFIFDSTEISNSADTYSKADYLKHRLHTIINQYKLRKVHLILIAPNQFCTLLGILTDNLNAEINLYFLNDLRDTYIKSGTITNNTF